MDELEFAVGLCQGEAECTGGLPEMVGCGAGGKGSDVCVMGAKELDLPLDSHRRHWVSERWFVA